MSEDSTSKVIVFPVSVLTTMKWLVPTTWNCGKDCRLTDLHTTTETKDEMKSGFLLNVVIGQGAAIFKLLAGKDETLLIRRNAFLVLNFRLDIVDCVGRLHLQGDSLPCQRFYDCKVVSMADVEMCEKV